MKNSQFGKLFTLASLRNKFYLVFFLILVASLVQLGSHFFFNETPIAGQLEKIGDLRLVMQQIATDASLTGNSEMDSQKEAIKERLLTSFATYTRTLAALQKGDSEWSVTPLSDSESQKTLKTFEDKGKPLVDVLKLLKNESDKADDHLKTLRETLITHNEDLFGYTDRLKESVSAIAHSHSTIKTYLMIILIVFQICVILISFVFILIPEFRSIDSLTQRIRDISQGEGDLSQRLVIRSNDELGELAGWFNAFLEQIQSIIVNVRQSSKEVFDSTEEIAAGSSKLANRTNEEAASIAETSSTLEKFTSIIKKNSENSREADMVLEDFNKEIRQKETLIKDMTDTMMEISHSSKQIDEIVVVINDISFQTNLLALNAAVEAARAGEAGRGFAVVAAEVRNLAQKTAESSTTIKGIVSKNVDSTRRGMALARDTSEFFSSILMVVTDILNKIKFITEGSREQSTGIEQISSAISQLEKAINQNISLVQDLADSGKKMKDNSVDLDNLVRKFKVDDTGAIKKTVAHTPVKRPLSVPQTGKYPAQSKPQTKPQTKSQQKPLTSAPAKPQTTPPSYPSSSKPSSISTVKTTSSSKVKAEDDFFATDMDDFEEF